MSCSDTCKSDYTVKRFLHCKFELREVLRGRFSWLEAGWLASWSSFFILVRDIFVDVKCINACSGLRFSPKGSAAPGAREVQHQHEGAQKKALRAAPLVHTESPPHCPGAEIAPASGHGDEILYHYVTL